MAVLLTLKFHKSPNISVIFCCVLAVHHSLFSTYRPLLSDRLDHYLSDGKLHAKSPAHSPRKVLVLGSGGLSIGQAGEFDYSGSQVIDLVVLNICGTEYKLHIFPDALILLFIWHMSSLFCHLLYHCYRQSRH